MECSLDKEVFCVVRHKIEGFPTLLVYIDGILKEEYPGANEVDDLMRYLRQIVQNNPPKSPVVPIQIVSTSKTSVTSTQSSKAVRTNPTSNKAVENSNKAVDIPAQSSPSNSKAQTSNAPVQASDLPSSGFFFSLPFICISLVIIGFIAFRMRSNHKYSQVI